MKFGKDSGVAEVIGTILIFAVTVTLVTSFLAWYIPIQQAHFEADYLSNTEEAFFSFADMLHSQPQSPSVSVTFPLGIGGTPPITEPSASEVLVSPNETHFSVSMKLSLALKNDTNKVSMFTLQLSRNVSGQMSSFAVLQYVLNEKYLIQDGSVIASGGSNSSTIILGPLPVQLTASGKNVSIYSFISGFSGRSSAVSSQDPAQLVFSNQFLSYQLINGSLTGLNSSISLIYNMTLEEFNYTINSPYASSWDSSFYSAYNRTLLGAVNNIHPNLWNFTNFPVKVKYSAYNLTISLVSPVSLSDFTYFSSVLGLQET
ncbi:MAG: hypothetical protein QW812_02345 [Thermoplasmataceae archaeon]